MIREALDLVVDQIYIYRLMKGSSLELSFLKIFSTIILYFGCFVLILALLMGVFMFFMRQTIIVMSRYIEYDLRKDIYAHYQELTPAFYKRHNTGDMMARISEDVSKVRMYVGPAVLYGINLVTLFTLVIYSMFKVNVMLSVYSLLPLPFLSISIYFVSALINKRSLSIQKQLSVLTSHAQEAFSGIRVIKSYAQESSILHSFESEAEIFKKKSMHLVKIDALFYPSMLLLIGISIIVTTYIGGLKVISGEISPGNIAEFVIYVNMLVWPVTSIGWIASLVQQASASQERINEFMFTKPEIQNHVSDNSPIEGNIHFKNLTFDYPDSNIRALDNFDLKIVKGEKIAIIGRTGSGKTTVAELLIRMYDPTQGAILIDGKDVKEFDLNNLRRRVGYVPQDSFLFSDTVSNNIGFGIDNITKDAVESAAKQASIHDEIMLLPNGYETIVGERGVTLSGGQKQRISIARALIKKPDILLLDDSLSAVDTGTEQNIINSLNNLFLEKTLIVITHRIYSKLKFDKIVVLDRGKILEAGTHDELLAKQGYYYDIFEQQKIEDILV